MKELVQEVTDHQRQLAFLLQRLSMQIHAEPHSDSWNGLFWPVTAYFILIFLLLWTFLGLLIIWTTIKFCREKMIIEVNLELTLVKILSLWVKNIVLSVSMYLIRTTCLSVEEKVEPWSITIALSDLTFLSNIAHFRGSNNILQAGHNAAAVSISLFLNFNSLSLKKY